MKKILIVLIIGLILLNGCVNDRRMLELEEAEARLEEAKAHIEEIEKVGATITGRADETLRLMTKLEEQCKQEIDLYFKAIKSIDISYEFDVLSNQMDKDGPILEGLCFDVNDELIDKGQFTNENLVTVYERLSKELSAKNKEVRDKLTDLYPDKLETQSEEETSRAEIGGQLLDDLYEHFKNNKEEFHNKVAELMDRLKTNCENKQGSSLELCLKCYDELITQGSADDEILLNLWSDSSDEIIEKGQNTDVNLQSLYEESINRLDVKTQEMTQDFINLYNELHCNEIP